MKLATQQNVLDSNMQMESRQFRIGNMQIIMEVLSKLYSNPIQTLTQEYISNGRDSMREAGNKTDKMHITLPTQLNPVLKIRDFGVGLSEQRIDDVFLAYGMSTKNGSNVETGGFGIGGKSFLSYTDSLTITSWYDGMKSTYMVYKSEGNLKLDTLSTVKSKEKNGVLIELGIKPSDIQYFVDAVHRCVYFWDDAEKPTIKGDGVPEKIEGYRIGQVEFVNSGEMPDFVTNTKSYYGNISGTGLVIDGIFYKLNSDLADKIKNFGKLQEMVKDSGYTLIHLGNGEVQIAPSREEIVDNEQTLKCLNKVVSKAYMQLKNEIMKKFKGCETIAENIAVYSELSDKFKIDRVVGDYTLKDGIIFSDKIGSVRGNWNNTKFAISNWQTNNKGLLIQKAYHTTQRRWNSPSRTTDEIVNEKVSYLRFNKLENVYHIDKELSALAVNNHVRTLLESGEDYVILIPHELVDVAEDLGAKKLSEVEETKKSKVTRTKIGNAAFQIYKYQNSYYTNAHQVTVTLDQVKELDEFYWVMNDTKVNKVCKYLTKVKKKTVYRLTKKAAKEMIGLDNAISVEKYIEDFTKVDNSLNNHIVSQLSGSYLSYFIPKMNKIQDKFWTKMVEYAKLEYVEANLPELLTAKPDKKGIKEFDKLNKEWKKHIKTNYPLLDRIQYKSECVNEIIDYINLVYKG